MSTSTVVAFVLLLSLADSAPLPSDPASLLASPQIWLRAQAVVQKILLCLPQLHAKTVSASQLSYEGPTHQLHLMAAQLQVPTPPLLQPLSATFTAGDSVRRMWEGLVQQQRIVGDLSTRLSVLSDLHADLRDLGSQVATSSASSSELHINHNRTPQLSTLAAGNRANQTTPVDRTDSNTRQDENAYAQAGTVRVHVNPAEPAARAAEPPVCKTRTPPRLLRIHREAFAARAAERNPPPPRYTHTHYTPPTPGPVPKPPLLYSARVTAACAAEQRRRERKEERGGRGGVSTTDSASAPGGREARVQTHILSPTSHSAFRPIPVLRSPTRHPSSLYPRPTHAAQLRGTVLHDACSQRPLTGRSSFAPRSRRFRFAPRSRRFRFAPLRTRCLCVPRLVRCPVRSKACVPGLGADGAVWPQQQQRVHDRRERAWTWSAHGGGRGRGDAAEKRGRQRACAPLPPSMRGACL
uniref:Uncharacterized protein n=1 Tax=Knipowitschia caucasica TaxID=637954 RepID=A0AAV2KHU0_KNICA